jgi:hypothetical protein
MNWTESAGAKEYRDHLGRSLEVARGQLSDRDFRAFAVGIRKEIIRLDGELSKRAVQPRISCPITLGTSALVSQSPFAIARVNPSIRFNSPADSAPWTSWVVRYDAFPRTQAACGIPALSYVS